MTDIVDKHRHYLQMKDEIERAEAKLKERKLLLEAAKKALVDYMLDKNISNHTQDGVQVSVVVKTHPKIPAARREHIYGLIRKKEPSLFKEVIHDKTFGAWYRNELTEGEQKFLKRHGVEVYEENGLQVRKKG